jgi:uridine kinase
MKKPLVIGIAGGSGSGKTTFAESIIKKFPEDVTAISHDYYYKPFSEMNIEERYKQNFDHPDSFDTDIMVSDIKKLVSGEDAYLPVYSFVEFTRLEEKRYVKVPKVLIVEGILIFHSEDLRNLCDIKIFIDADADERFIRRLVRDIKERGRTVESVIESYLGRVKPMHNLFVEPTKKLADIIVTNGGYNIKALDVINGKIGSYLSE